MFKLVFLHRHKILGIFVDIYWWLVWWNGVLFEKISYIIILFAFRNQETISSRHFVHSSSLSTF